jgi:hypothetical protein
LQLLPLIFSERNMSHKYPLVKQFEKAPHHLATRMITPLQLSPGPRISRKVLKGSCGRLGAIGARPTLYQAFLP